MAGFAKGMMTIVADRASDRLRVIGPGNMAIREPTVREAADWPEPSPVAIGRIGKIRRFISQVCSCKLYKLCTKS